MRCFIGVGGVGCQTLKDYERTQNNQDRFIYIDAVKDDLDLLDSGECYPLTNQKDGCSQRMIGKDEIKAVIYNGAMPDFVDDFFLAEELEVVFVTTTFGGFGSAVVYDLSDYYGVKIKKHREENGVLTKFMCKVIALPLCSVELIGAPEVFLKFWGMNEIEFINEFRKKELRNNDWYQQRTNCIPFVELFVPFSSNEIPLHEIIGMDDEELYKLDIKGNYHLSPKSIKNKADVFISYSSKNQKIADLLVETAKDVGLNCWISSSNIGGGSYPKQIVQAIENASVFVVILSKDSIISPHVKNELDLATARIREGLIIMPFKIDGTPLDDDCRYYLSRHETFSGERPPIEEKIQQFVNSIKNVLEE